MQLYFVDKFNKFKIQNLFSFLILDLHLLHLTCCGLNNEEWTMLSALGDNYTDTFTKNNIDFKLTCDLYIIDHE